MAESALTSRERILALVVAQPGLHLRELPRRLGLSLRSVRYHLETPVDQRLVTAHRSGRYERWFAVGSLSSDDRALISALRVGAQRTILSELQAARPTRFAALERATALPAATTVNGRHRLSPEAPAELGRR